MKKRSGTDGTLLASLPWTLATLALATAPHLQYLPAWITATLVVCALVRWQIERRRWRLPPPWLRGGLAVACFAGVFVSYEAISGVGPGSALLAVMAALKLLETRQRRDQYVLLFISIFLIMSSLLREQYLWSLPFLLAATLLTMTAWLRMSTATTLAAREGVVAAGRMLLYAAPLALAMWVLFPRIATPFWAVPIDGSSAVTGLSDRMSPGDISDLTQSDAVAFRVTFDGEVPPPALRYWRGLVLHRFNGRTWSGSDPTPDFQARDAIEASGTPLRYHVTLEPTRQQWIFALDIPYRTSLDHAFMGPQQQLARVRPIDQRIDYDAVSYPDYSVGRELSRTANAWYSRLPEGSNPRTRRLATEMRTSSGSDEAYFRDVLAMFNEQEFYYTLQPPALGSDPVDRFLFGTRRGFCEHYASAFAVMMRAAGIPARIVLGYQGGEMNRFGRYMIVRQSDAHAWTEIWLPGRGWLRVDPTAAVAPTRIDTGMAGARFGEIGASWGLSAPSEWLYNLQLSWDALNARWNEWILGYGPENQLRFMRWFGMQDPDWRKMLLALALIGSLVLTLISFSLLRRYRPPPADPAARLYRKFTQRAGVRPQTGETPVAYARRLAEANGVAPREAHRVVRAYLAARYGPPSQQALGALRAAVAGFRPDRFSSGPRQA